MVVDNFDRIRAVGGPGKTNAELLVDANTELAASIAFQGLEVVPRRHAKGVQRDRGIELIELPLRDSPKRVWTGAPSGPRVHAVEDVLGTGVSKRANHRTRAGPVTGGI